MKRILSILVISLVVALGASNAFGLSKQFGTVRIPGTGLPATGASVEIKISESQTPASIFADKAGAVSKQNPFIADGSGYYEFYAANGEYDIRITHSNISFNLSNVVILDPSEPQTVTASPSSPALTLERAGPGYCFYNPGGAPILQAIVDMYPLDRHVDFMRPLVSNAHWGWDLLRAEVGFAWHYNGTSGVFDHCFINTGVSPGPYSKDDTAEPIVDFGINTADFGNFGIPGVAADYHGGGLVAMPGGFAGWFWPAGGVIVLAPEAGTAINVQMGVEGSLPIPGDLVVLSTTTRNAVTRTSTPLAKAPFVVTQVDGDQVTIAIQGIAPVNVSGSVAVGDILVSSADAGYAMVPSTFNDTQTLGYALTGNAGGYGSVLARVGLVREGTPNMGGNGPDLFVTNVSGSSTGISDSLIDISDTTANVGVEWAGTSVLNYYLSSNTVITKEDTFLGTRVVGSLAPGTDSPWNTQVLIPADVPAGDYYLGAIADIANEVAELNPIGTGESNNATSGALITITNGADLVITNLSAAPGAIIPGGQIVITETVSNQGTTGAGAEFAVAYYLSTDTIFDGSDILLGSRSVQILALSAGGPILRKGWNGAVNYRLEVIPNNAVLFSFDSVDGGFPWMISNSILEAGVWNHVAATYDGSTARIYINGVEDATGTGWGTPKDFSSQALTLGRALDMNTWFTGRMDDVRIYGQALMQSEIGSGTSAGLVAHYPMDETSGTVVTDLTLNGHDGVSRETGIVSGQDKTAVNSSVSFWSMDESVGTTVADAMGGNDGIAVGTAIVGGISGKARSFNGSDYIQIPGNPSLKPATVTVGAWIKTTSTDVGGGEIVSMGDRYGFRLLTDGNLMFFFYNGAGWISTQTSGLYLLDGQWHHVVGEKTATELRIYVDGVIESTLANTDSIVYLAGGDLYIGKHGGGQTSWDFNGIIDELGIWETTPADLIGNYGLYFNGKGADVTVADSPGLRLSGPMTLEAWVNLDVKYYLAAGGSDPGSMMVTIPFGTPAGLYYILAVADSTDQNPESNEGNNVTSTPIQVIGPPTATTNSASGVSESSATLNGTVNPSGAATSAWFEWGLDTTYGQSTILQSIPEGLVDVNVSEPISGLSPETFYHFRVVAQNAAGTVYGTDQAFTSGAAISAPANLTATRTKHGKGKSATYTHDLSWDAVTGAVNYNVYQSTSSSGPWNLLPSGTGITTTTHSEPADGSVTLFYVVTALNAGGTESAYSNWAGSDGTIGATEPTPLGITTTSLPDGTVNAAYSQFLQATGGTPPYTWSLVAGVSPTGLSLNTTTGEISGTPTLEETQSFTVRVTDSLSDISDQALSIIVGPESQGIAAPASLSASVRPKGKSFFHDLLWDVVPGAAEYNVYRSPNSSGPWTSLLTTVTTNEYSYKVGTVSTPYCYVVTASDGVNPESPISNWACSDGTVEP